MIASIATLNDSLATSPVTLKSSPLEHLLVELEDIRREYLQSGLNRCDLLSNPLDQFALWMQQAINLQLQDATAMTLATVSKEGQPSQRIVLLKHLDDKGFVFYTNYESKKSKEIQTNSNVSLHFPWHSIERQVKVSGIATKISAADSLKYFLSRPEESQITAWASAQSRTISSKNILMQQVAAIKKKFHAGKIPLPDFWGGYLVTPHQIEFWQGGEHRLHDRFQYTLIDDNGTEEKHWEIVQLAP